MNIEIRRLTPALVEDYCSFFDTTPHADGKGEHKCYCVWWCHDSAIIEGLASSVETRRAYAIERVLDGAIQGYLAYRGDQVVGWCNANAKADCLESFCWQRFMSEMLTEDATTELRVKSIFCLAIAPEMRRQGIASRLVDRVCQDAVEDGFDWVEAYPNKAFVDEAEDFMGPAGLYRKSGFCVHCETDQKLVMRMRLQLGS